MKRQRSLAGVAVIAMAIAGCSTIQNKLGKGGGPAAPAATDGGGGASPSAAGTAGGKAPATAKAPIDRSKLPAKLAELLDALEGDPSSEHVLRNKYDKLNAATDAFAARWKAYRARKTEIDAVLAKLAPLEQAKSWAKARDLLESAIAPPVRNDKGKIVLDRTVLEPVDAELPAVHALIRVAAAQQDYHRLAEASADLYIRREVGEDREQELLVWLAAAEYDIVRGLAQVDKPYVEPLLEQAFHAGQSGGDMTLRFMASLRDFGLVRGRIETGGAYGDGDWGLLAFGRLDRAKVDDTSIAWSRKTTWEVPYDCVTTGTIDAINPVTGQVTYEQRCKFRRESQTVVLHAGLARPLPAWHNEMGMATPYLVARIDRQGPSWKLSRVTMPDLRFLDGITVYPWRSPF